MNYILKNVTQEQLNIIDHRAKALGWDGYDDFTKLSEEYPHARIYGGIDEWVLTKSNCNPLTALEVDFINFLVIVDQKLKGC